MMPKPSCLHCERLRIQASEGNPRRGSRRRKKLAVLVLLFIFLIPISVWGLTELGIQILPKPPSKNVAIHFSCPQQSLVNVTNPDPLLNGLNGTAVFGCSLSSHQVSPAFQVLTSGTVNATLSIPAGVVIYLVPNSGSLGQLSQSACSAGFLLASGVAFNLPVGSYSYCEAFQDPALLVPVSVYWYQT